MDDSGNGEAVADPAAVGALQAAAWEKFRERAPEVAAALPTVAPALAASAPAVLAASDFVLEALCADPSILAGWIAAGGQPPAAPYPVPRPVPPPVTDATGGDPDLSDPGLPDPGLVDAGPPDRGRLDEAAFMAALRQWRRRELVRIAWRDLAQLAPLESVLADLSAAADAALRAAHDFAHASLAARLDAPRAADGREQSLIIVAMGKLGGSELNFSSDIDLVFVHPPGDEQFFTRLAQALIRLLSQRTADGFVFRVDMRLRPFGDSGPLVSSVAALEDYLQRHGRDWERYAWVKARAVTGISEYAQLFQDVIRPFVYRRYLDFSVFESLRQMKGLIEREVARRDLQDNVKLGDGGIREIEFITQAFQLIRGGQDRRLQCSALRQALPLLAGAKLLPVAAVAQLEGAYEFLRRLENRLQMRADQQTHQLPSQAPERLRIAASMGFADWNSLLGALEVQRQLVSGHFRATVFGSGDSAGGAAAAALGSLWESAPDLAGLRSRLAVLGYPDDDDAARLLLDFSQGTLLRRLDATTRGRLTALVPLLADEAVHTRDPLATLRRLLRVIEAIGPRGSYFSLLLHSARVRSRLVQLAAHGDFLSNQIASHPLLLDELIDARLFEQLPDRAELAAQLQQRLAGVDEQDGERLVEQLRHFQRAALFRIAVADLFGGAPVMRVSDRLTDLAELIVEQALALVWQQLTPSLGVPMCGEGASRRPVRICVVGYGKLGGMELSYASDLDLVFLHDSSGSRQETSGERAMDNQVYFVRFVQRLVHLLTMHSAEGRLYEVDMRLRPSGKGGMFITHMDSFLQYQRQEAWTWEHQALLHARAVAGDALLRQRFEAARSLVLREYVRRDTLRAEVRQMRNRMRSELSRARPGQVDLKQDPGGIADIEFLAQYWALRWAREFPPVAHFADTIRQLESVASADLVPQARIDLLTRAYRTYRACLHRRALDGQGAVVPAAEFAAERAAVSAIWNQAMEDGPVPGTL